jgi:hypothetical protein
MFDNFMQPFSVVALVAMAGMICHFVVCNVRQGEAGCLVMIGSLPESFGTSTPPSNQECYLHGKQAALLASSCPKRIPNSG